MTREIHAGNHQVEPLHVPSNFDADPASVLAEQAQAHGLRWLLAHADDGVIWGELRDGGLHLSGDAFPQFSPPLRAVTLQQVRLFGPDAELLLWKDDNGWQVRLIRDSAGEDRKCYDESYLLWGDQQEQRRDGFVLVRQGKEGLRHALPLPQETQLPARLQVRHYLTYDPDGQAYIAYSRLVGIVDQGDEK
jgi:CRISPR-associated protein (TIGR03984 family)